MSVSSAARKVAEESVIVFQNLIGGKWQPASDGRTIDMVSPSDGQASQESRAAPKPMSMPR